MSGDPGERRALPAHVADRVGRTFNLMFNRVSMYHMDHPSTQETLGMLGETLQEALKFVSPLTLVLDRERLYVEEEPLDPKVSAQRLVTHMKKAGIESVSFEKGMTQGELVAFGRVFGDLKSHPTADSMKQGLLRQGIQRIRINHVFFRKVTADEEVVARDETLRSTGGLGLGQVIIDLDSASTPEPSRTPLAERAVGSEDAVLLHRFEDLTLASLLEDPSAVGRRLLGTGPDSEPASMDPRARGEALIDGIRRLRAQVEKQQAGLQGTGAMDAMVEAVFKLRQEVQEGARSRMARGEILADQGAVFREMDDLTDQVMVQLVREEYKKGQISVKRLAQILRRMMPDVRELRRLLPRLKEALLADGMPLADYLQLVKELERELQSEELAAVLEEGAEDIGLSATELLREMRKDPRGAAELITLAAEIRSMGSAQDPNVLAQILAEYVDRLSGGLALEQTVGEGPEGGRRLKEIISRVQEELLEKLRAALGRSSVMRHVEEKLAQRRSDSLEELKREWVLQALVGTRSPQTHVDPQVVLQAVSSAYPDQAEQAQILEAVIQAMMGKGMDVAPLQAAVAKASRVAAGESDPQKAPKGTYNRTTMLFWLREEVKRAKRYPYAFSALLLSVKRAVALRPVPLGLVRPHEVRNALMEGILPLLREVDLVGCLEENKVLVVLPFTGKNGVKVVRERIHQNFDGKNLTVRNVPMRVNLALAEETFHKETMGSLQALMARLEARLGAALKG